MIRHIAVSLAEAGIFATAEFKEKVSLWSIRYRKKLAQIRTILDFGARRLAVVQRSGRCLCVAANFDGHVNAYDLEGNVLWSRKDLTGVQQLTPMHDGGEPMVGIGAENQPYKIVDTLDGRELVQLGGVREVYGSSETANILAIASKHVSCLESWDGIPRWERQLNSFGVLDGAFSPVQVAYSEVAGAMYCFDLDGKQKWVLQPEKGHHFIRVAWNQATDTWMAVDWNYEQGGSKRLLEINTAGNCELVANIGTPAEAEFISKGTLLITSDGDVLDSESGAIVWHFQSQS